MSLNEPLQSDVLPNGDGFSHEFLVNGAVRWRALRTSLVQAGVAPRSGRMIKYRETTPWHLSGSETYSCAFEVEFRGLQKRLLRVICKALTPIGPGNVEEVARAWRGKAEILESLHVKTGVYGAARGCVFQEFIAQGVPEFILAACRSGNIEEILKIRRMLKQLAIGLGSAGFKPVALLGDLRMEGFELVLVDLGNDLGGIGDADSSSLISQLLDAELAQLVYRFGIEDSMAKIVIAGRE